MTIRTVIPGRETLPSAWRPQHLYAIRYATRPTARKAEHFFEHLPDADSPMPIDYFVWLIAGPGAAILVDAGFTPETAEARPGRIHLGSPLDVAEALGYPAESVRSVIVSHAHYDHTGYLTALPHSRIHIQERELAFWTGRHAGREMYSSIVEHSDIADLVRANLEGRVDLLDGDAMIADGVTAHRVGGHTPGMQVVRVQIDGRDPIVLASDASHFYANIEGCHPFSITHETPAMYDAFDAIHRLAATADGRAGTIVAGHDPIVADRFEDVGGDRELAGRVWRIA